MSYVAELAPGLFERFGEGETSLLDRFEGLLIDVLIDEGSCEGGRCAVREFLIALRGLEGRSTQPSVENAEQAAREGLYCLFGTTPRPSLKKNPLIVYLGLLAYYCAEDQKVVSELRARQACVYEWAAATGRSAQAA